MGVCGPLDASGLHDHVYEADLSNFPVAPENVEWIREHEHEFTLVNPEGTNICMLCRESEDDE